MIDGIIKGDGTSRLARSVANIKELYPTYDSFIAALAAGTLPLDILFNAEGWSQLPDFLNRANLLKDEVAISYGKDSNAVPNDIFALIKSLLDTADAEIADNKNRLVQMRTGTYTGTNSSYRPPISLGISPDFFICGYADQSKYYSGDVWFLWIKGFLYGFQSPNSYYAKNEVTVSGTTISWDNERDASGALNAASTQYRWVAIKFNGQ